MKQIKNLEQRKERFLRDTIPIRLGGLAANLARVKSFSENDDNSDAVFQLLEESKYFIEWTGRDLETEIAIQLVDLQRKIAHWQFKWDSLWADESTRETIAKDSARWSLQILSSSGLLGQ